MVTSELGACEWFVWDLRKSGLIDRGHLDQLVSEFLTRSPRAEPPALAEHLVNQSVLTAFQAERILQGKTQGLVLGPYVLVDAIGAGSMGQVYRAQSKTDNQWYAVKVLPRRSMWNVRLARRQVRAFSQFSHPAVVPFVDVGTAGGQHYLVWPLVEGVTLETKVQHDGRLAPDVAGALMSQVAQGLAAAHGQGLFHGLLKPSNILIGADGQAKLLDFGIGSLLAENEGESLVDTMSTANTLTSGLDCSSPESIMEPTNRTQAGDQYSFGCVLYYCLAGQYPFADGTAVEKMMAHQFKQPTPLKELAPKTPDGLVAVIERLMQKSPDGRYAGMDEVVDALHPFAQDPGRRGGHFGTQRPAQPPAPAAAQVVPSKYDPGAVPIGGSRFDSGPPPVIQPTRFDSTAVPIGGSKFDNGAGARAPAAHQPPSRPVSSPQVTTPPGGPMTPVPKGTVFGGSRFGGPEPTRAKVPPAPTRATFNRGAPEVARALPVAMVADDSIPEALPVEGSHAGSRFPGEVDFPTGWDARQKEGGVSVFMVFLITALVTTGVYLLGKSFLFD